VSRPIPPSHRLDAEDAIAYLTAEFDVDVEEVDE
jgi:hypothetical protein